MPKPQTGKLVPLRPRPRSAGRGGRLSRPDPRRPPGGPAAPSREETVWLGRVLFVVAGYLTLYWLAVGSGAVELASEPGLRAWLESRIVGDLFVTVIAALAGFHLLGGSHRAEVLALVAAGALSFLALGRLTYGLAAGMARDLTAGERFEVAACGIFLVVGAWIVSHALRTARPAAS